MTAVAIAVIAAAWWAGAGAHRGWTKTSVERVAIDEVTGLEARTYEKKFVPGIDFLGAALLGAGVLAGVSCLVRKPARTVQQPT